MIHLKLQLHGMDQIQYESIHLNSNKQKTLKNIGKEYDIDGEHVITTDVKRTAIIVSCRSNNASVVPFVAVDSNTWKAKVNRMDGGNITTKKVYVTFFYFE